MTGTTLDDYTDRYARRVRGMTASEIRALFAVASRPEVVSLAGGAPYIAALPLVFLTEIGFIIAFGVLLDTFIVRSVIVPALAIDLGPRIWWPSAMARAEDKPPAPPVAERV